MATFTGLKMRLVAVAHDDQPNAGEVARLDLYFAGNFFAPQVHP
jgi:hypothetical protein